MLHAFPSKFMLDRLFCFMYSKSDITWYSSFSPPTSLEYYLHPFNKNSTGVGFAYISLCKYLGKIYLRELAIDWIYFPCTCMMSLANGCLWNPWERLNWKLVVLVPEFCHLNASQLSGVTLVSRNLTVTSS